MGPLPGFGKSGVAALLASAFLFLSVGLNPLGKPPLGATAPDGAAFVDAAQAGKAEAVRRHLAAGMALDAVNRFGETALFAAAGAGRSRVVTLLLDAGAPVEGRGPRRNTPLIVAAQWGHRHTVKLLLARGANHHTQNKFGFTALWLAALVVIVHETLRC